MSIRDRVMPVAPKHLEFVADKEPWSQWTLEDGTVIRARLMLVKVTDEGVDGDGVPRYQMQFQQVQDATWPPEVLARIEAHQRARDDE